jgi:hypothetical protein
VEHRAFPTNTPTVPLSISSSPSLCAAEGTTGTGPTGTNTAFGITLGAAGGGGGWNARAPPSRTAFEARRQPLKVRFSSIDHPM